MFLLKNKVLFSIRLKAKMYVTFDGGRAFLLKSLLRKRGVGACFKNRAGRFSTMPASAGTPLRFAAKRLKDGEHLIIVTNGNPGKALRIYKQRWFIECLFGDSKTRGLNMEDTHMTELQQTVAPYRHSHPRYGLGLCLRKGENGPSANQQSQTWIFEKIMVQNRIRSASKLDFPPARQSRSHLEKSLAKATKLTRIQQSRVVCPQSWNSLQIPEIVTVFPFIQIFPGQ